MDGDCIAGAKEHIPDDAIDLIITDPLRHQRRPAVPAALMQPGREVRPRRGHIEVPAHRYGEFSLAWIFGRPSGY